MHRDPTPESFQTRTQHVIVERQPVDRSADDTLQPEDAYVGRDQRYVRMSNWRSTLAGMLVALTTLLFLSLVGLSVGLTQFNAATAATQGTLPAGLGRNVGLWMAFSMLLAFLA